MNFSSLFSLKKHDTFAESLSTDFIKHCPPSIVYYSKNRKSRNKLNKSINKIYIQANDYRCKNKLNLFTKARIGNKFMWALKEAGYDDILIDELTNGILHALEVKNRMRCIAL
jgi:hypothetical protein